jgi:hypothetical protein
MSKIDRIVEKYLTSESVTVKSFKQDIKKTYHSVLGHKRKAAAHKGWSTRLRNVEN